VGRSAQQRDAFPTAGLQFINLRQPSSNSSLVNEIMVIAKKARFRRVNASANAFHQARKFYGLSRFVLTWRLETTGMGVISTAACHWTTVEIKHNNMMLIRPKFAARFHKILHLLDNC